MNNRNDSLIQLVGRTPLYTLVGPPGTGKTTRLSKIVRQAVDSGWDVLIASLTKTAAREVVQRDLPVDDSRIGTLHAHAYRALGGRLDIAEGKDGLKSWAEWIDEKGLPDGWALSGGRAPSPDEPKDGEVGSTDSDERTDGDEIFGEIGVLRSRLTSVDLWPTLLQAFFGSWCEWKAKSGFTDFEDLIERCAIHHIPPALSFDALYVDECQDLSASEVRLCATWAQMARAFVMVGDPRQCLYEWRGSDPDLFGELIRASKKTDVLRQSWRVPGAVHAEAVAWVSQLQDGLDAEYLPKREVTGYTDAGQAILGDVIDGSVERRGWSLRNPEMMARELVDETADGSSAMCLTTCSYMLRPLISSLRAEGIPFHNPYRTTRGDWNPLARPNSPTSGAGRLVAFSRVNTDTWGDEARFWTPKELAGWADALPADMFVRGGKTAIKRAAEKEGQAFTPSDLESYVTCRQTLTAMLYGDLEWYREHLTPKTAKGSAFALNVADKRGVKTLLEKPRVIVGTCHSVKGGEADRVYLWPDLSPSGYDTWCGNERGQVIRQMYVGMTRAKRSLVLCNASSGRSVVW